MAALMREMHRLLLACLVLGAVVEACSGGDKAAELATSTPSDGGAGTADAGSGDAGAAGSGTAGSGDAGSGGAGAAGSGDAGSGAAGSGDAGGYCGTGCPMWIPSVGSDCSDYPLGKSCVYFKGYACKDGGENITLRYCVLDGNGHDVWSSTSDGKSPK